MAPTPEKERQGTNQTTLEQPVQGTEGGVQSPEQPIDHLEAIEREPPTKPITHPVTGENILTPTNPQQATVINLPMTEEQTEISSKLGPVQAARWLAEFSKRLLKKAAMFGLKVVYPNRNSENS